MTESLANNDPESLRCRTGSYMHPVNSSSDFVHGPEACAQDGVGTHVLNWTLTCKPTWTSGNQSAYYIT